MEKDFALFGLAMGFLVGEGQEQFVHGTSEEENAVSSGPTRRISETRWRTYFGENRITVPKQFFKENSELVDWCD